MFWEARHEGQTRIQLWGHGRALPLRTRAFQARWLASTHSNRIHPQTVTPVSHRCSWPCPLVFLRFAGPPPPPQLLSTRSPRHVLFDVPLSPSFHLHTLPLLDTRNCPPETVSSPPARCSALPSLWWPTCSTSVFSVLSFSPCLVNNPFHSSRVWPKSVESTMQRPIKNHCQRATHWMTMITCPFVIRECRLRVTARSDSGRRSQYGK